MVDGQPPVGNVNLEIIVKSSTNSILTNKLVGNVTAAFPGGEFHISFLRDHLRKISYLHGPSELGYKDVEREVYDMVSFFSRVASALSVAVSPVIQSKLLFFAGLGSYALQTGALYYLLNKE